MLIVGTDQPEQDWAQCLEMAGLLDEDDRMHPCIHKLFHTGAPLHLDEEGIVTITEICQLNTEMWSSWILMRSAPHRWDP